MRFSYYLDGRYGTVYVMTPRQFRGEGVNTETGEVIEIAGQIAAQGRRHQKKQRRHPVFALVDMSRLTDLELTQHESKVFWAIADSLTKDSGSIARIGTGEIAERVSLAYSNVGAALTSLKRRRIIRRERVGVWAINPWLIYAGSAEDWETATEAAPQPEWTRP